MTLNPYETATHGGADLSRHGQTCDRRKSLRRKRRNCIVLAIAANAASIALVVWMYVGGLITYAPGISANRMQNIYLSRVAAYGAAVIILQVIAIGSLVRVRRSASGGIAKLGRTTR